jgi:hypothetical protein
LDKKSNVLEKFEFSLPFNQVNILAFSQAVRRAHAACGNQNFVTISALRKELNTPSWKPLEEENSILCKILRSDAFKNPKHAQTAD